MRYFFIIPLLAIFLLAGNSSVAESTQSIDKGKASWYRQKGCLCAASTKYPRGTRLRVTHARTRKFVDVRVNDYGPDPHQHPDRVIDLDVTAFKLLASKRRGLIPVEVTLAPAAVTAAVNSTR